MSRTQNSSDFYADYNKLRSRVDRLERIAQATYVAKDVNTSGLTSAQIDAAVFGASTVAQPFDGLTITDKTNSLLLVRVSGKWGKVTLIIIT